jgi:biopolymer transport protein ExbD
MKFPRNARIFRGQLDAAPYAIVFSCLLLFLLLSSLVYTPGVSIRLPVAPGLAGTDKPTIAVAMDRNGRLYFDYKSVDEAELRTRLKQAVAKSPEPLTLLLKADRAVTLDQLDRLQMLAREAGIFEIMQATLPAAPPGQEQRP